MTEGTTAGAGGRAVHEASGEAGPRPTTGSPGRSAEQIRRDIGLQQRELSSSMEALRTRVRELSDWRRQVREHRTQLIAGAAVAGFVVGGLAVLLRRKP